MGANYPHFAESFEKRWRKMQVGQNAYEADVLTAIKTDQREIFYDIVGIKPIKIETSRQSPRGIQRFEEQRAGGLGRGLRWIPRKIRRFKE